MANPGQATPPGQMSNADQGMDIGMMPRDPDQEANQVDDLNQAGNRGQLGGTDQAPGRAASNERSTGDTVLDAEEEETLEHGGYGGEQEYSDAAAQGGARQPASRAYPNQTDMTDETGDTSRSESADPNRLGQGQRGDEGITGDERQGGL